jgi:histidinol phosphatase-like enzyme (inositol monophosphatase family)
MHSLLMELARISAQEILPHYNNSNLQVEMKADHTPVTIADRRAEEVMRTFLDRECPDHGVIGEEFPPLRENAEYTWILDPIDGTKTFAAGCPLFGTLIGLRHREQAVWGAIHLPALNLLYIGNNSEAWLNGVPCSIRNTENLRNCCLLTTDPKAPSKYHSPEGWQSLLNTTGMYRTWGDCFGYTLIASGGADIMCDPTLNLWDLVALLPVLRGAGAAVCDWQGKPADTATSLIAAHPQHIAQIVSLLNP